MSMDLAGLVTRYLADENYQDEIKELASARNNNASPRRRTFLNFINQGQSGAMPFSQESARPVFEDLGSRDRWLNEGARLARELSQLIKLSRADGESISPADLLALWSNLASTRLGEKIDACAQLFRAIGKQLEPPLAPARAAFHLSLLTRLSDNASRDIIYYEEVLYGLRLLLDAHLLSSPPGLHLVGPTLVVESNADHAATVALLQDLTRLAPTLTSRRPGSEGFEPEFFLRWLVENKTWWTAEVMTTVPQQGKARHNLALPRLTSEELSARTREIRTRLLVSEDTVRRIYEGLLAGNVVLAGPPGTGKTELARLIPEILWGTPGTNGNPRSGGYTTSLVTATDGWSVHTLLGSLMPHSRNGQVHYHMRYGHLTEAVRRNWLARADAPQQWDGQQRISVFALSQLDDQAEREFDGLWLIIDEFNRAPIDLALGEALTTFSGGGKRTLLVETDDGFRHLPIPADFRLIGTLNSFDRNYLNQISEALKRRFTFIEIAPPARHLRGEEMPMVLKRVFAELEASGMRAEQTATGTIWRWNRSEDAGSQLVYNSNGGIWETDLNQLQSLFGNAWTHIEVVRIYRKLGTAQIIALTKQLFIKRLFTTPTADASTLIDEAFCDVIADQLQILMPEELDILSWYADGQDETTFRTNYNNLLARLFLDGNRRRIRQQLEALSAVSKDNGESWLAENQIDRYLANDVSVAPEIAADILRGAFNLGNQRGPLPQFAGRLRAYRRDRGI